MAQSLTPPVPLGEETGVAAVQQSPWRNRAQLSSFAAVAESFLAQQGVEKGPWTAVFFASGIAFWFAAPNKAYWLAALSLALWCTALLAFVAWREGRVSPLWASSLCVVIAFAAGLSIVWIKSEAVGQSAIPRPLSTSFTARVLERIEQPAHDRVRLIVATRLDGTFGQGSGPEEAEEGKALKIRLNVPLKFDLPDLHEGSLIRVKARLMPPGAPLLPGGYDFARSAWFQGLAATGSVSNLELLETSSGKSFISIIQRGLSSHVKGKVGGQPGAIAAAFASGDRGAITKHNEAIMRDSGLTHLLSVSGVHVSAVIACGYLVALKLLGLWPWFVLRVRLPIVAAACGAVIGIGYTLVTGMEIPTVRSCLAALLVLFALVLGRQPLSMRMLACAALAILIIWPEALVGPSFQMSFAAVLTIVALHNAQPAKAFLAPRDESILARTGRRAVMLFITGLAIELALMPIIMFHFHRAGIYGSLANLVAIPLVTIVSLPAIGLGLLLDILGLGAPAWWVVEKSLQILLGIAELTAAMPGAVNLMPQISRGDLALYLCGLLVLALLKGPVRVFGLVPIAIAVLLMVRSPVPDVLITADGTHVALSDEGGELYLLRDARSSYIRDNLFEMSAFGGAASHLQSAKFAQCSPDFCVTRITRDGRAWTLLLSLSDSRVPLENLKAACAQVDIVVANRRMPKSCTPRVLKADAALLRQTGGMALYLKEGRLDTVAHWQGRHGWWKGA